MNRPSLDSGAPAAAPSVRGSTRLALGVVLLIVSYFAFQRGASEAPAAVAFGLAFMGWGIVARRRSIQQRAEHGASAENVIAARQAAQASPERQQRLAAWKNGSMLAGIREGEPVLTVPCTWYVDGARGLQERDGGTLSVEHKALRLSGQTRAQTFRFTSVVRVTAKSNALVIECSNGPHVIVAVDDPEEVALAIAAVQVGEKSILRLD
jgi:hypothetical protein